LTKVALLGTKFTMEEGFYRDRLAQNFGIEAILPEPADRDEIHRIIYEELVKGEINDASREFVLRCIAELELRGAQGIIAGCTEIELLVKPNDVSMPYFPSSFLHAEAIANFALES
jgi:aspartate racemase